MHTQDTPHATSKTFRLKLNIWRQKGPNEKGRMVTYAANNVNPDMSFLEMLDVLNEELMTKGEVPIAFDYDCREGICGSCGFMIDGVAHGPHRGTTVCQLHMRHFKDGDELSIEPFRARAFPILKDLCIDRTSLDRVIASGGFISTPTGSSVDGNTVPIRKVNADLAMDAAACIGCGACVAACPNASVALFSGAKITHLALLPQGQPERYARAVRMVNQATLESFGQCTNIGECTAACPKEIRMEVIGQMNRDYMRGKLEERPDPRANPSMLNRWGFGSRLETDARPTLENS